MTHALLHLGHEISNLWVLSHKVVGYGLAFYLFFSHAFADHAIWNEALI
jgi:hypothetical protein